MNMEEFQSRLKDKIEKLKKQLTEVEEELKKSECKAFKPKLGDEYYYIDCGGGVFQKFWQDNPIDNERYAIGNCFETQKEAKFEVERLKVIAELKRFAEEHNEPLDWNDNNQCKAFIVFDGNNERIDYCFSIRCKRNDIYFSSKDLAKQAVEKVGEDRIKKYYLGVE